MTVVCDNKWETRTFLSGTMIVTTGDPSKPHYYVYGPKIDDEGEYDRQRYQYCIDLENWLNGGKRPEWMNQMVRISEEYAVGRNGARISATGPVIDIDPPNLRWMQDESFEAQAERARLMDKIFLRRNDGLCF